MELTCLGELRPIKNPKSRENGLNDDPDEDSNSSCIYLLGF